MQKIGLKGWDVVIAGGDAREVVLAEALRDLGSNVCLFGFAKAQKNEDLQIPDCLPLKTDALILPLSGVNMEGYIFAPYATERIHFERLMPLFRPGMLLLSGSMPKIWLPMLEKHGITLILTTEIDELALYNAVPTAEGAVVVAMRESAITLSGSKALVTGFGRCGLPLARLLAGMDAHVTVAARKRDVLALAQVLGFTTVTFDSLADVAADFDFLFNTVPALILTADVLANVKKTAVLIDIATSPGGSDFTAAQQLGLKNFLLPGLPGKVAPITAGQILAKIYQNILIESRRKEGEKT